MRLVIFGAPGAGKGTQAELIGKKYKIPTISTGNIIRETIKSGSKLGDELNEIIDKGNLVPDNIVIEMINKRIAQEDCENGYILDGFPRTIAQAEALMALGIKIDAVLNIDVDDKDIVARMSGRRVCSVCGNSYHIANNPPKDGHSCDGCKNELSTRHDDLPETVTERLRIFHKQTEPLKDFYKELGIFITIDGRGNVADTTASVFSALEAIK